MIRVHLLHGRVGVSLVIEGLPLEANSNIVRFATIRPTEQVTFADSGTVEHYFLWRPYSFLSTRTNFIERAQTTIIILDDLQPAVLRVPPLRH